MDSLSVDFEHPATKEMEMELLDLFCCQNALIDSVFMRNSDDCIALYNNR